ncbi:MAG TPA: DUF1345 domain-containing protein [Microbacteriaceae bacterium]
MAAPIAGWASSCLLFSAWAWIEIWRMDARNTHSHATREDPGRAIADLLMIFASIAALVAIVFVLVEAKSAHGSGRGILAGLAVASVALSWVLVHTLYTLRYARLYYARPEGGVSFNQKQAPRYSDFAYLAFTIGMTFQVSDTNIEDPMIRATILRHMLLSYLFGSVILATTINFVVGLS